MAIGPPRAVYVFVVNPGVGITVRCIWPYTMSGHDSSVAFTWSVRYNGERFEMPDADMVVDVGIGWDVQIVYALDQAGPNLIEYTGGDPWIADALGTLVDPFALPIPYRSPALANAGTIERGLERGLFRGMRA